ncbi:MAG: HAD-IIIA family hydrolase [Kiritimatiellae bacterium]|nr:HAD-IIIA family hydrolase [Kiritimatiellia bacterium]
MSTAAPPEKRPALFFDRDGVANASPGPGYVNRLADFRILPGFLDCVRAAAGRGWPCVVVTNQRGVSRGLTPPAELEAMHGLLRRTLADRGLALLDILVCTAADDNHPDRKPNPGLLLTAAARHNLDLSRSWMVGDREKDVETGRRAGVAVTVRLDDDGTGANPDKNKPSAATYRVPDIAACADLLRTRLPDLRAP